MGTLSSTTNTEIDFDMFSKPWLLGMKIDTITLNNSLLVKHLIVSKGVRTSV